MKFYPIGHTPENCYKIQRAVFSLIRMCHHSCAILATRPQLREKFLQLRSDKSDCDEINRPASVLT